MSRVEIRVLGQDQAEVESWVSRVVAMAREVTEGQVYQSHVSKGRKGDYLVYIGIHPPQAEPVAARLPRKNGHLSSARHRRSRR